MESRGLIATRIGRNSIYLWEAQMEKPDGGIHKSVAIFHCLGGFFEN
jgi:hypothetical protein